MVIHYQQFYFLRIKLTMDILLDVNKKKKIVYTYTDVPENQFINALPISN